MSLRNIRLVSVAQVSNEWCILNQGWLRVATRVANPNDKGNPSVVQNSLWRFTEVTCHLWMTTRKRRNNSTYTSQLHRLNDSFLLCITFRTCLWYDIRKKPYLVVLWQHFCGGWVVRARDAESCCPPCCWPAVAETFFVSQPVHCRSSEIVPELKHPYIPSQKCH